MLDIMLEIMMVELSVCCFITQRKGCSIYCRYVSRVSCRKFPTNIAPAAPPPECLLSVPQFSLQKIVATQKVGVSAIQCPVFQLGKIVSGRYLFSDTKKPPLPKRKKASLQKKGQKDTVDGRNPANHLGCTKPCK